MYRYQNHFQLKQLYHLQAIEFDYQVNLSFYLFDTHFQTCLNELRRQILVVNQVIVILHLYFY